MAVDYSSMTVAEQIATIDQRIIDKKQEFLDRYNSGEIDEVEYNRLMVFFFPTPAQKKAIFDEIGHLVKYHKLPNYPD